MKININEETLNFTLENEKNLLQIIDTIEEWLMQKQIVINTLNVDGKEVDVTNRQKLETLELKEISIVNIETLSKVEMALSSITDASSYIDRFLKEMDKEKEEFLNNKDEKIEGLRWLSDLLFSASVALNVNCASLFVDENSLEEVIAFLSLSANELETKKHDNIFFYDYFMVGVKEKLKVLKSFVPIIISHSFFHSENEKSQLRDDNIRKVLTGLKNNLYHMSPTLTKISENLQSGNDVEALIGIKKIAGVLENLVSSIKRIEDLLGLNFEELKVNGKEIENINKNLLTLLNELFDAFQKQDTVLLADLIEYELIEYFESYKDVIETLIIITNQKKMVN